MSFASYAIEKGSSALNAASPKPAVNLLNTQFPLNHKPEYYSS